MDTPQLPQVADLQFEVRGECLNRDHRYALFAAINKRLPQTHSNPHVGVFAVTGSATGEILFLNDSSRLTLRLPLVMFREYVSLAGALLDLDGFKMQIGVPKAAPLRPSPVVYAECVCIKAAHVMSFDDLTPVVFLASARRQLAAMGIADPELHIPRHPDGRYMRRFMRVRDAFVMGYPVLARGLTPDQSVTLQIRGVGGKRTMGCGLFHTVSRRFEDYVTGRHQPAAVRDPAVTSGEPVLTS
jgi:CRISPR-associated protein Cas6